MGNDQNVPKTMSVSECLAWAVGSRSWPGQDPPHGRVEDVNRESIRISDCGHHSPVSHHRHLIADNYVMETVRKRS